MSHVSDTEDFMGDGDLVTDIQAQQEEVPHCETCGIETEGDYLCPDCEFQMECERMEATREAAD